MLLCLALIRIRNSKLASNLDLLGLCLSSLALNTKEFPLVLPQLYAEKAIKRLYLETACGVMLGCVFTSTVSLFTRTDSEANNRVDSNDIELNGIDDTPTTASVDQADLSTSLRRTAIVLLLPQMLVSLIIIAVVDGFHILEVRILPMLYASVVTASPILLLAGYMFGVGGSMDLPGAISAFTTVHALKMAFEYDMSGHQLLACACILIISYSRMQNLNLPIKRMSCMVLVLFCIAKVAHLHGRGYSEHPLHGLLQASSESLQQFEMRERRILTLENAIEDYESRYGRIPPPGFDIWFDYAKKHDTLVLSDFDQIEKDLAPFWNIKPSSIRQRTYIAIQDRFNYISPLRIRNGSVSAPPMEIPTHYWMLERLMEMMTDFVAFLPDMDLAINLNDEPRVLARRHRAPRRYMQRISDVASFLTPDHWKTDIPFTDETPKSFRKIERKNQNTFDYSTRFCPTRSLAKMYVFSGETQDNRATYIRDWQESLDVCEQPQLRDSRGLFVSPSAYDATDELLPIFSQSKPSTFSDILLPSPWNYGDKVGPDTIDDHTWEDKWDRVYWRGSTTEGWATSGTWRVMLRQRLVDLLGGAWDHATSLVPKKAQVFVGHDVTGYVVTDVERQELYKHFDPDVFFVSVDRADDKDADDQAAHFRLQEPLEFKEHWRHRFLLDTDGAAFSGRFLPFLQSHSLPLKLTSVFTEWWSDRVFAYQHFVPVTTENVFSTLAYFIGIKTAQGEIVSDAHQQEAKKIAEQGLRWSEKVLRKEDMKIYLWRLLLEYGRVVDDQRDKLGYPGVRYYS